MSLALGNTRQNYNIAGGCVEFGQNRTEIQPLACSVFCNAASGNQETNPNRLRSLPVEFGQNRTEIRQRGAGVPSWDRIGQKFNVGCVAASSNRERPELKRGQPLCCATL